VRGDEKQKEKKEKGTVQSVASSVHNKGQAMTDILHIVDLGIMVKFTQQNEMAAGSWKVLQYADNLGRRMNWYEVHHGEISETEKRAAVERTRQLASGR
jgi:hypothetical protein